MEEMSAKRLWCTRRASPGGRIAARERGGRPRRSSWRLSSSPRRHTLRPCSRRAHDPLHDLLTPLHDPLARSHARNDSRRLFSLDRIIAREKKVCTPARRLALASRLKDRSTAAPATTPHDPARPAFTRSLAQKVGASSHGPVCRSDRARLTGSLLCSEPCMQPLRLARTRFFARLRPIPATSPSSTSQSSLLSAAPRLAVLARPDKGPSPSDNFGPAPRK